METVVISALASAIIFFLVLGLKQGVKNKTLSDIFPVFFGKNASIKTSSEFSSSTVATTISLATIIMAYFQLAGYFGFFLIWTSVTTALGMYLVSKVSGRIWDRTLEYDHRPTLHEFLGREFNSNLISVASAICTCLGFLLIAALELIVGSLFLSALIPSIPQYISTIILSAAGVIYLVWGGFRSVIRSDVWQMKFIWLLIVSLFGYYIADVIFSGNLNDRLATIPKSIYDFSGRPGLWMFLLGVTVMNIPTHLSNQGIFQRINASQNKETVNNGMRKSIKQIFLSWTFIITIACLAYMFVPTSSPNDLLPNLLIYISQTVVGKIILFIVVIGMYSALLSTASTNLVVIGHVVSEDIIARFRSKNIRERDLAKSELTRSRIILLVAACSSVLIVEGLKQIGFDVKDLVFAIYGGSLALFPAILFALFNNRARLQQFSKTASLGIIFGFLVGWGAAFYGKFTNNANLIFLSPVFSIGISTLFILCGYLTTRTRSKS
jgi:SSS family solute:Na+ symporter